MEREFVRETHHQRASITDRPRRRTILVNSLPRPAVYNLPFWKYPAMEAERINILANRLADLSGRCTELRRYL
ncbi:MAG TPA: hypothetical protein VMV33_02395 [Rhodocyclaceae bacterium]|nr:hypothetical protein [Rhodocyclaceae bacterium]